MSFWDWVKPALPTLITAGATLVGAKMASSTQNKAANTAATAVQDATAADLQAIAVARQGMQQQQAAASPGLIGVQNIIGRGDSLTPAQTLALDDARRTTLDALQGGSLRGSARATVAAVNDVEGRMRTGFMDTNRTRADTAATNLSGQYFNAGKNIQDLTLSGGKSASAGLMGAGEVNAANQMGQGIIKGQAIGDIGAIIAGQMKDADQKARDSTYKPIKETITWNKPGTERL